MWGVVAMLASPILLGFLFRKRQPSLNDGFLRKRGLRGRKMGPFELAFDYGMRTIGLLLNVNVVFIGCKTRITVAQVRHALRQLYVRHPMLRMGVVVDGVKPTERYFVYVESEPQLEVLSTGDWMGVMHQELEIPFKASELQWRVKVLDAYQDNGKWIHPIIFSFNHAIMDGGSMMAGVNKDFHKFLNDVVKGEMTEVESLPLIPCRDELFPEIYISWLDFFWLKLKAPFSGYSHFDTPSEHAVMLQKVTQPDSVVKPASRFTVWELDQGITKAILGKCKQHGIKFNGYLASAVAAATVRTLREKCGPLDDMLKFKTSYLVNLRRFADPPVLASQIQCNTSFMSLVKHAPKNLDTNVENFWTLAAQCNSDVHEDIAKNIHYEEAKSLAFAYLSDPVGTLKQLQEIEYPAFFYYLTNRGAFSINLPGEVVSFEGTYWATAEHCINDALFVHSFVTINGKLMYSLTYHSHKTTDEYGQEMADLVKEMIVSMSK